MTGCGEMEEKEPIDLDCKLPDERPISQKTLLSFFKSPTNSSGTKHIEEKKSKQKISVKAEKNKRTTIKETTSNKSCIANIENSNDCESVKVGTKEGFVLDCSVKEVSYLDFLNQSSGDLDTNNDSKQKHSETSSDAISMLSDISCNTKNDSDGLSVNVDTNSNICCKSDRITPVNDKHGGTSALTQNNTSTEQCEDAEVTFKEAFELIENKNDPVLEKTESKKIDEYEDTEILPSKPPKGCRAITNFFAAGPRKVLPDKQDDDKDHVDVLIVAEIHQSPEFSVTQAKVNGINCCPGNKKAWCKKNTAKCNAVVQEMDMTITHIETTYITIEDDEKQTKSKDDDDDDDEEEMVERKDGIIQVASPVNSEGLLDTAVTKILDVEMLRQPSEKSSDKSKTTAQLPAKENSNLPATVPSEENEQARRVVLATQFAAMDCVSVSNKKTAQATLNFGSKGMTIHKPIPKIVEVSESKNTRGTAVVNCNDDVAKNLLDKTKLKKAKHMKKNPRSNKLRVSSDDEDDFPETRRLTRNRKVKQSCDDDAFDKNQEPITPRKKRVINGVYTSTLVDPVQGKKRTPLKIKFTRVGSNGSNEEDAFTPKSKAKKQTSKKAQQLLQKAKSTVNKASPKPAQVSCSVKAKSGKKVAKALQLQQAKLDKPVKVKGQSKKAQSPEIPMRRSTRMTSLNASQMISLSYKDSAPTRKDTKLTKETPALSKNKKEAPAKIKGAKEELPKQKIIKETPTKRKVIKETPTKRKTTKDTPTKQKITLNSPTKSQKKTKAIGKTPQKTKKAAVSLAPIFGASSKKKSECVPIAISSEEEVELTEEEKEAQRIRRQFLLSGVPQTLRKQIAVESSIIASEFTPLPNISHVQQIQRDMVSRDMQLDSEALNMWNLPDDPLHKLALRPDTWCSSIYSQPIMGHLSSCCKSKRPVTKIPKERLPNPCIREKDVPFLLAEIASRNTNFPVRRIYRHLLAKKHDAEKQESVDSQDIEKLVGNPVLQIPKNKKRKQPDESEPELRRGSKRHKSSSNVVVVDEEPTDSNRLSLRTRHKKDERNQCETSTDDSRTEEKTEVMPHKELLWTEKYAPRNSADILGNMTSVKKVKSWLVEWKHRTDSEMKKLRKEQMKQAKKEGKTKEEIKKNLGDDWQSSDSDFDLDTDDSSSETDDDNDLCNSMLITGPHGVGKTSMIYGLAQELGYKVFEVNSSSRRSGKQILSQLQEATQSHQVSKQNMEAVYADIITGGQDQSKSKQSKTKQEKNVPTSFANFFKKPSDGKTDKCDGKGNVKDGSDQANSKKSRRRSKKNEGAVDGDKAETKKTRKSLENTADPTKHVKKGLNLSSVSMILFDEVDLVFEEDKGFWAAIQTFMATTKRPIILTATDPHFLDRFKGHVEKVVLKPPVRENVTSYLQVLCLAENLRTSFHDLLPLVTLYKQDIRKLLLSIQTWATTDGSLHTRSSPIIYKKRCLKEKTDRPFKEVSLNTPTKCQTLAVLNSPKRPRMQLLQEDSQSGDEFVMSKPRQRARRLVIQDDDELSRDSQNAPSPVKSFQNRLFDGDNSSQGEWGLMRTSDSGREDHDEIVEISCDVDTPRIHDAIFYSITGATPSIHTVQSDHTGLQMFEQHNEGSADLHLHYLNQKVDLVYSNLYHLLPLPKVKTVPKPSTHNFMLNSQLSERKTRIMNKTDLYDSEGSSEGFVTLSKAKLANNAMMAAIDETDEVGSICVNKTRPSENKEVSKLVLDSLNSLASLFDGMSYVDSYLDKACEREGKCSSQEFDFSTGQIISGQLDDPVKCDNQDSCVSEIANDVISCVTLGNLKQSQAKLKHIVDAVNTLDIELKPGAEERISMSVRGDIDRLCTTPVNHSVSVMAQSASNVATKVSSILPLSSTRSCVAVDYLPTIRTMCRAEQIRMATGNKRRFFHYLDPMVNQMKESTLGALCTSFL